MYCAASDVLIYKKKLHSETIVVKNLHFELPFPLSQNANLMLLGKRGIDGIINVVSNKHLQMNYGAYKRIEFFSR